MTTPTEKEISTLAMNVMFCSGVLACSPKLLAEYIDENRDELIADIRSGISEEYQRLADSMSHGLD